MLRYGAYLPHLTREDGIYFVTFRLADSLPKGIVEEWRRERDVLGQRAASLGLPLTDADQHYFATLFTEKMEKFLDAGQGACWMNDPRIATLVQEAFQHFEGQRYSLVAWCVMPNHVHVVLHPFAGYTLSTITHSWKSFTAKEANKLLGRSGEFWQMESYDHLICDAADLERCVSYTYENPVSAGLKGWSWRGRVSHSGTASKGHE